MHRFSVLVGCVLSAGLILELSGCGDGTVAPVREPLQVVRTYPWQGASGVPLDVSIQVVFQRDVLANEFPSGTFLLNGSRLDVLEVRGATVTLRPSSALEYNRRYNVVIALGAWQGARGLPPMSDFAWTFTTDPGPPGLTWSRDEAGTTADLNSISNNADGLYVAGSGSTLLASWHGGTWTRRTYSVPPVDFTHVYRRGGSLDLLIDTQGVVYVSRNGVSWDAWSPGVAGFTTKALDVGRQWVLVGDSGGVSNAGMLVTYDGHARAFTLPQGPALADVFCDFGGRFLAVGTQGTILQSNDGWPWTAVQAPAGAGDFTAIAGSPPNPVPTTDLTGASTRQPRYVAVGPRIASANNDLVFELSSFVPPATLRDVIWTGTRFVAVGDQGTVASSVDGIAWVLHDPGTHVDLKSVASASDRWFVVGAAGTILISPASTPL